MRMVRAAAIQSTCGLVLDIQTYTRPEPAAAAERMEQIE